MILPNKLRNIDDINTAIALARDYSLNKYQPLTLRLISTLLDLRRDELSSFMRKNRDIDKIKDKDTKQAMQALQTGIQLAKKYLAEHGIERGKNFSVKRQQWMQRLAYVDYLLNAPKIVIIGDVPD